MEFYRQSKIPTREEFHRMYAGEISISDFCTQQSKKRKVPHYTLTERKLQSKSKNLHQ
jgi:hypothetical protein